MLPFHVAADSRHNDNFEYKIKPRQIQQANGIKHDGTRIECKDVRPFHQGQRQTSELVTKRLRDIFRCAVFLTQHPHQPLELRSLLFLRCRIVNVCLQKRLPLKVPFPWSFLIKFPLLCGIVKLAPGFSLQKEEMNLAVIVGNSTLAAMASEARLQYRYQ